MNRKYLQNNIGKVLRLRPEPWQVVNGQVADINDGWLVESCSGGFLALRHESTGSAVLISEDNVTDYRTDPLHEGFLILKAQIVIGDGEPRVIPLTHPTERISLRATSLIREAYFDVSADCYEWKNAYLDLRGWDVVDSAGGPGLDVWDAMRNSIPGYDERAFESFKPLFLKNIVRVRTRIDRAIALFGRVLPDSFQAMLVRASRQLLMEQSVYLGLPRLFDGVQEIDKAALFQSRFRNVIDTLQAIAKEIDRRVEDLQP